MDSVSQSDRPAQRRRRRCAGVRNKSNAALLAAQRGGTDFENAQNEPRTCQNGGLRRRIVARGGDETKPMGFVGGLRICETNPRGRPRVPGTARTNPRRERRDTGTARTKPRSSGWKGLHRSEELRHRRAAKGRGASRRNKATSMGEEWIETIGGILTTSGGNPSGRPSRETFGRSGRRDRAPCAQPPRQTGWP
jgi:hypothetical protein